MAATAAARPAVARFGPGRDFGRHLNHLAQFCVVFICASVVFFHRFIIAISPAASGTGADNMLLLMYNLNILLPKGVRRFAVQPQTGAGINLAVFGIISGI